MINLSVRSKIIFVLVTLSIISLGSFGYVVIDSFTKDKEAYVIKTLLAENQYFSELINSDLDAYESAILEKLNGISMSTIKSYRPKEIKNLSGIQAFGIIHDNQLIPVQYSLFFPLEKLKGFKPSTSQLAILSLEDGLFSYSLKIQGSSDRAFVIFRDTRITQFLKDTKSKKTFIKTPEGVSIGNTEGVVSLDKFQDDFSKSPFGLIKVEDEDPYFLTFSHLKLKGYTLYSTIKMEELFSYKRSFYFQMLGFVILFISICCLVGVVSANWLTKNLNDLTDAAKAFEKENFAHKINISSNDEFSILGGAFNQMGSKINELLSDLRRYNTQLEEMVEIRTIEIQNLSRIQRAMLNSLGQSFTLFDQGLKISPLYSQISREMYNSDPVNLGALGVMAISPDENEVMNDFVQQIFQEIMPFDQLVELLPKSRSNAKGDSIVLDYAPIRNEVSGNIEYVMVIGTDKTQEFLSQKQTEKEIQFSKMLMSIIKNPASLKRILVDSHKMLEELKFLTDLGEKELLNAMRIIHTIKGSFSVFRIKDVSDFAGAFEEQIDGLIKTQSTFKLSEFTELCRELATKISSFIKSYGDLARFNSGDEVITSLDDVREFRKNLVVHHSDLIKKYDELFLNKRFSAFFDLYPGYVEDLCSRLGKRIVIDISGGELPVPDWFPENIFAEFIHLLRNSADHGIEAPSVRESRNKPPQGTIKLSFVKNDKGIVINFSDDGQGIDLASLSAKDPSIKTMNDAIERLTRGGLSSKDTATDLSGRGVGLSAILQMVQASGGEFKIDSVPGKGTSFAFIFVSP